MKTWKSTIFWKVFLMNMTVLLLFAVLVLLSANAILPEESQQQHRYTTDESVRRVEKQITLIVKDFERVVTMLQSTPYVLEDQKTNFFHEVKRIVEVSPFVDSAVIIQPNGDVEGFYPSNYRAFNLTNLMDKGYFQEAFKTQEVVISEISAADTGHFALNIAVPTFKSPGELHRIVKFSLHIEENELFQSIFQSAKIGEDGYTYMVDSNGRIISHPQTERIGEMIISNPIVQEVLKGKSGYERVENTKGVLMYASYRYVPFLRWGMVAQVPVEATFTSYFTFQNTVWKYMLVGSTLILLLTAWYSVQLVRPLKKLGEAMDKVTQGNYDLQVELSGRSEIGRLSQRFNEMISYIRLTRAKLQSKEAELFSQKEYFRNVINMNPNYIFAVNAEDEITLVNETCAKAFGVRPKDMVGKQISDLPTSWPFPSDMYRQWADSSPISLRGMEHTLVDAAGEIRWIHTVRTPLQSVEGPATEFLYVCSDITERKQTEELIRKSEKLSVVGELAAGVAHEIRNPLTAIKGFIQLLQSEQPEKSFYHGIMMSEIERINEIVSEFLVLSRPQAYQYEEKDIEVLLKSVMMILNTQAILKDVEIEFEKTSEVAKVYCEENQLKQVFINVIKNAIEAMPDGGQVRIVLGLDPNKQDQVLVRIRDEGYGIPSERISRLGEPFYTTKEKGMGLGLMVSYRIIEAHQGRIRYSSEVGHGTTVDILLPTL
jgi:two-component system sporulation sensor kinase A